VTWDNRDVLPAHGPAARAEVPSPDFNRERSPALDVERFPQPRPGRDYGPGVVPGSFPRYDSGTLTLAASTAFQQVRSFSGRPDRIDLHASAAGVEFRLRNKGQDQSSTVVTRAAGPYETDASFDLVEARDPAGAGGQFVSVVGYWRAESSTD